VQGFGPAIVNVECGNDSYVITGGIVSLPIGLAGAVLKRQFNEVAARFAVETYPHTKDPRAKNKLKLPSLLVPRLGKKPMMRCSKVVCSVISISWL
jgi:hypothetical protein